MMGSAAALATSPGWASATLATASVARTIASPITQGLFIVLVHHGATVHVERLPGDVPRLVRGQEHRRPADVLGRLLPLHRDEVGHALVEDLARRHALERRVGVGDVLRQPL